MMLLKEFSFARKVVVGFALTTALLFPMSLRAEEDVTLQGEIVDLACYMAKGLKGTSHRACAQMCAKKGAPIGVLTDAGDVYLLIDDHNNPDPYEAAKKLAGDKAEIKGKKFTKGGVASVLVTETKGL